MGAAQEEVVSQIDAQDRDRGGNKLQRQGGAICRVCGSRQGGVQRQRDESAQNLEHGQYHQGDGDPDAVPGVRDHFCSGLAKEGDEHRPEAIERGEQRP
jgi:hypothetical protein